jgi:hypothetical protein
LLFTRWEGKKRAKGKKEMNLERGRQPLSATSKKNRGSKRFESKSRASWSREKIAALLLSFLITKRANAKENRHNHPRFIFGQTVDYRNPLK